MSNQGKASDVDSEWVETKYIQCLERVNVEEETINFVLSRIYYSSVRKLMTEDAKKGLAAEEMLNEEIMGGN